MFLQSTDDPQRGSNSNKMLFVHSSLSKSSPSGHLRPPSCASGLVLSCHSCGLLREEICPLIAFSCRDRLVSGNEYMIENFPLQVYESALVFSPTRSMIRSLYEGEYPKWIQLITGVEENWLSRRQTLAGHHSGYVAAVVFSSGGKLVASASRDKTVRLWDVATGAASSTLRGRSDYISAVAFSPDSKLVASASTDDTVRLWDAATGAALVIIEVQGYMGELSFVAGRLRSNLGFHPPTLEGATITLWPSTASTSLSVRGQWVYYGKKRLSLASAQLPTIIISIL